jgi:Protein phosphatase 2C
MNSGFALDAWHFLLPKEGCFALECEDAVAQNIQAQRFAIADGATEGFDSRAWARFLVRCWIKLYSPAMFAEDFQPLARDLGIRMYKRWKRKTLSWYAEEKARSGSFAAFLGVQFYTQQNQISWTAIAIGDCCLVHQRGDTVRVAFPISNSEDFGSHPMLLPSLPSLQDKAFAELKRLEGTAEEGDEFILLSDSIAAWYLRNTQDSVQERNQLLSLMSKRESSGLEQLVRGSQRRGTMRNDDVVVMRIVPVRS